MSDIPATKPDTMPQTMMAIEISEPGGPHVLKPVTRPVPTPGPGEVLIKVAAAGVNRPDVLVPVTRPVPQPGPGEVLVKVAAAGVNRPDILQRKGAYPPPPGASDIPGLEISGTVVAAGEGGAQLIGTRVCALVAGGGYAEYCLAPVGTCLPVPEVLRMTEAAAIPETLFTGDLARQSVRARGDRHLRLGRQMCRGGRTGRGARHQLQGN